MDGRGLGVRGAAVHGRWLDWYDSALGRVNPGVCGPRRSKALAIGSLLKAPLDQRSERIAMADHAILEKALIDLIHGLLAEPDVDSIMGLVTGRLVDALRLTGAGISLVDQHGVLRVGHTTNELVRQVEDHHAELQQGPGRDAFDRGHLAYVTREQFTQTWPDFAPTLHAAGIYGAASLPMTASGEQVGCMCFYWSEHSDLSADDLVAAKVLADAATVAIVQLRRAGAAADLYVAGLEAANESLRALNEIADKARQAKDQFLSHMSHELRTPLNAILGFGQLLEIAEQEGDHDAESIQQVLLAGRHLLALVEELLDIARIEAGEVNLTIVPVAVRPIIEQAVNMIGPLTTGRGIVIDLRFDDGAPTVSADAKRLLQILLNLLSNATKYNHRGGHITVTGGADPLSGLSRISVTDTGPGLNDDQLAHLFEPFQRLGAERTDTPGTGIGLALTQMLVHHMGGLITVQSRPNEGSTFTIELPTAAASDTGQQSIPLDSARPGSDVVVGRRGDGHI